MSEKNYALVKSSEELTKFVDRLLAAGTAIAFDIETGYDGPDKPGASLHPEEGFVVGISFTNNTAWARYVPVAHELQANLDTEHVAREMYRLLMSGLGVPHNGKFERRFLSRFFKQWIPDVEDDGYFPILSDTLIEAYILAEWQTYALKYLTKTLFKHDQAEIASLFPGLTAKAMKSLRFNHLELTAEVVSYACEDAVWTLALHERNYPLVKDKFLYGVEMAILDIICRAEDFGVKYDWPAMQRAMEEVMAFMTRTDAEIQAELTALVGTSVQINLGSSAQVAAILFDKLGMKSAKMTPGGKPSTDAIAMAALSKQYPVVKRMTQWREMKKLHGTYLAKYQRDYDYAPDGMTHPNHMQTAVGTGRFAVSDPPYQQTPKKYYYQLNDGTEFKLNFREFVVCPPQHYMLGFDYSQVELRMMAGAAQEPTLLAAFNNDEDVHTATAALMLGISKESVTPDQRAIGKTMNFALLYGMGPKALADRLAISKAEGQALYDQYFQAYSAISVWVDRQVQEGKKRGYTISKFGRRFTIWEFQSQDAWIYSKGERLCVNAPIQGAAADYMKISMVKAHRALKAAGLLDRVHLVMNIHDALEYYVHESVDPLEVIKVLKPAVEYPVQGLPKIVADWHVGSSWGKLKELKFHEDGSLIVAGEVQQESDGLAEDDGGAGLALPAVPVEALRAAVAGPQKQVVLAEPSPVREENYAPDNKAAAAGHEQAARALESVAIVEGKRVIVTLPAMPSEFQYLRWLDFMSANKGRNTLILRTPEGDMEHDGFGSSLTPADQPQVSMIFSGATVTFDADSVDASAMMSGLSL